MWIAHLRNYDIDSRHGCKCAAHVILGMGGRVYGKYSGRVGMLADTNMELLARDGRLTMLVRRPVVARMDVYITADHDSTLCVGCGRMMGGRIGSREQGQADARG
jgi:hypothetical protein